VSAPAAAGRPVHQDASGIGGDAFQFLRQPAPHLLERDLGHAGGRFLQQRSSLGGAADVGTLDRLHLQWTGLSGRGSDLARPRERAQRQRIGFLDVQGMQ
jgi:hypothetical protein